ncbi:MAG: YciI family protein [Acidimicrobiia bacterium]
MNFVLIAYDYADALDRRMAVRESHIARTKVSVDKGFIDFVVALKDKADGHLMGSVIVFNCDSKSDIDEYLKDEPYIKNNVWETIEITEGAIPQW